MSLFSDINGYNQKALNSKYERKNEIKTDFSEVDFCLNDEEKNIQKRFDNTERNIFSNTKDFEEIKEDYMYNYDITEEEAEDYISKHFMDEG